MSEPNRVSFTVEEGDAGRRLDQVLAAHVAGLSRRRARLLLDIGGVFVDGRRIKIAGRPMHAGEKVVAHLGGTLERATQRTGREARATDEARLAPYTVVFEDEDLIVVEKPPGVLTAPTPESDRNNLVSLLSRRLPAQAAEGDEGGEGAAAGATPAPVLVVHRIDLETSGLLVFAKTELANTVLAERFRTHDLTRAYLAVVAGAFPADVAVIDRPVDGRRAVTHVEIQERLGSDATLLRCRLETGRTHQIRLHARALGHPVLGDPRYGTPVPPALRPPRMALHATVLAFAHPRTGASLAFESPLPPDLAGWLQRLRG
jgi:23S rRNA pseudouridine1911/1915/1917 synthase